MCVATDYFCKLSLQLWLCLMHPVKGPLSLYHRAGSFPCRLEGG